MDVKKLAETYVEGDAHLKRLAERQGKLKELLIKAVDGSGETDDKGHVWLAAGDFLLQRQKRQGKPYLDMAAAEEWARALGIWDRVKVVREELDEGALAGWVFEHRKDLLEPEEEGVTVQEEYDTLWVTPPPSFAFMPPQRGTQYEY